MAQRQNNMTAYLRKTNVELLKANNRPKPQGTALAGEHGGNKCYSYCNPNEADLEHLKKANNLVGPKGVTRRVQGRVVNIYIPGNKNKQGRRFGFVRFLDVDNISRMEELSQIWIGSFKLEANLARFDRVLCGSERVVLPGNDRSRAYMKSNQNNQKMNRINKELASAVGARSYVDVGREGLPKGKRLEDPKKKWNPKFNLAFTSNENDWEWLRNCHVRELISLIEAPKIDRKLETAGVIGCLAWSMGVIWFFYL
ncbi:hypothetical protein Ancab_036457 [Ancistrocladus abbreviatus]